MELYNTTEFRGGSRWLIIPPDDESVKLIKVLWLIKEVRLTALLCPLDRMTGNVHSVDLESTISWFNERQQVTELLGWEPHGRLPVHIDNPSMKILVWNCQGAGDDDFPRCMRENHRLHAAEVVAILEPRVESLGQRHFFCQFGLTSAEIVEAQYQWGGIWLLWNPMKVGVTIIKSDRHILEAVISKIDFKDWVWTIVYGIPNPPNKDQLWGNLKFLLEQTGHPWTLAGGKLTHCADEVEGRSYNRRMRQYSQHINQSGLLGQSCGDLSLTCSNDSVGSTDISIILYRALESLGWQTVFPKATVRKLLNSHRDYFQQLLGMIGNIP